MSKKFLTSTLQGKALYKGDKVFSAFHRKFGIADSIFIDEYDGDVYINVKSNDEGGGHAHIRNVVKILD